MSYLTGAASALVFFVLGFSTSVLGPTLPEMAVATGVPLAMLGLMRSSRQFGQLVGFMPAARLLERWSPTRVLVPGALVLTLSLLALASSHHLPTMLAIGVVWGAAHAMVQSSPTLAVAQAYGSCKASILNLMHAIYGIGAVAGPLVADATRSHGWQASYLIAAGMCVVALLVFSRVRSEPEPAAVNGLPATWVQIWPYCLLIMMFNGANSGVADWLYTHAIRSARVSTLAAAQLTSLYWLTLTVGRLVTSASVNRVGERKNLFLGLVMAAVGSFLIVMAGQSVVTLALGVTLTGLGLAPVYPLVISLGSSRFADAKASVTGKLSAVAALGAIVMPLLQGYVSGANDGGMWVLSVACLFMLVGFAAIPIEPDQAKAKEQIA